MLFKLSLPVTNPMLKKLRANNINIDTMLYVERSIAGVSLLYECKANDPLKCKGKAYLLKALVPNNKNDVSKTIKTLNKRITPIIRMLGEEQYINSALLYQYLKSHRYWKDTDENFNLLESLICTHSKEKLRTLYLVEMTPFLTHLFPSRTVSYTDSWINIDSSPLIPKANFIART
jgi:hypothetical protein